MLEKISQELEPIKSEKEKAAIGKRLEHCREEFAMFAEFLKRKFFEE